MEEIVGKFNTAKVFASVIDEETREQVKLLLNQSFIKDLAVRIMPDCHKGKGCVIGTTMTIKDKIVPNLVGVDIGCGIKVITLGNINGINLDFAKLDKFIYNSIPHGIGVNKEKVLDEDTLIHNLKCFNYLEDVDRLERSLCSLGGGNHFIELDKDDEDNVYLLIHTGSRNLGTQVATYYQNKAISNHNDFVASYENKRISTIKKLKEEGREKEIALALKELEKEFFEVRDIPDQLTYLEGEDFSNYLHDMELTQEFASINRDLIGRKIVSEVFNLDYDSLDKFESIHNYINFKDMILRKGAISAYKNERLVIPINMRDGSILALGKEDKDYNYSAPHGAGRVLSRNKAIESIPLEKFEESMKGIYTTSVCKGTIDESPFAYKSINDIIDNIKETVEIIKIIKPIYNFKARN